jgi:HSP20 family protein
MNEVIENPSKPAVSAGPNRHASYVVPAVNVRRTADGYVLEVELPGVSKSDVEITFEDGRLTVTGHRTDVEPGDLVYRESAEASFRRAFDLDPDIDATRIEANIEQGLLAVRLPKSAQARPRQIAVG